MLEAVRNNPVQHFIFGSTSSVYGANTTMPFRENDRADHPLTIYAATKKAGELMAHDYAHLWGVPATVVRFFTVYGPWGRPDMALFKFVDAIMKGEPIDLYGEGRMSRDFTYVDDLVEAIVRLIPCVPARSALGEDIAEDSLSPAAPFRVVNIGRGAPVGLIEFVEAIEAATRQEGQAQSPADAARRRGGYVRERGLARAAHGLPAGDRGGRGGREIRRVVSGVLQDLM